MIYATEQQVVVTSGIVVVVGLVALCIGIWWGIGRGRAEAEEEARWAQEQARARRTHPVYRHAADDTAENPQWSREVAQEAWAAREETVLAPTAVISPEEASVTGWTRRMAADMDRFIADLISGTDEKLKEITR